MLPLIYLIAIGSLVCDILVIVKIFQANEIGLGILGIFCPLFTFIYGWIKATPWRIRPIMLLWTCLIIINIALQGVMVATYHQPVLVR